MLHRLYHCVLRYAGHPKALWILALVSFAESSFFPIPPDVLLIPMILARPAQAWLIAAVCTISSVLGGAFGYLIGAFLFTELGKPMLEMLAKADSAEAFNQWFNDVGIWAVIIGAFTPVPYKVITIMSGWANFSFVLFMIISLLARGARFFLLAFLLKRFGNDIRHFIEKRLGLLSILGVLVLLAGFWMLNYL